jgi:hypothetical protein
MKGQTNDVLSEKKNSVSAKPLVHFNEFVNLIRLEIMLVIIDGVVT